MLVYWLPLSLCAISPAGWPAQAVGHLERVEDELGAHVRRELPADDHAAVAVEDEGEIDEAVPGADVGDIGDPLLVRPRSLPSSPCSRITRATWSRPTSTPRRRSSFQVLRAP